MTLGGNGKETGKRHPTLKDNVMDSAGAKIIGSFTIGENSKIGAGSVVIEEAVSYTHLDVYKRQVYAYKVAQKLYGVN